MNVLDNMAEQGCVATAVALVFHLDRMLEEDNGETTIEQDLGEQISVLALELRELLGRIQPGEEDEPEGRTPAEAGVD